jgi:hypothetical protein
VFCREYVAQLRDRYGEFQAKGANVAAIGMGTPEMAADFRDKKKVPFPLLVDRTKETYRALELGRGSTMDLLGPRVWGRGLKAYLKGEHQGLTIKQDPTQLGGAAVMARGGEVRLVHRAEDAADNLPVGELLATLG